MSSIPHFGAIIIASKNHQIIARKQIEENVAVSSQDAKGGVAALNAASTQALTINKTPEEASVCH